MKETICCVIDITLLAPVEQSVFSVSGNCLIYMVLVELKK